MAVRRVRHSLLARLGRLGGLALAALAAPVAVAQVPGAAPAAPRDPGAVAGAPALDGLLTGSGDPDQIAGVERPGGRVQVVVWLATPSVADAHERDAALD